MSRTKTPIPDTTRGDLDERLCDVQQRLEMLRQTFEALASSYTDIGPPSEDTLRAFESIAEELRDEVQEIGNGYIDEANAVYMRRRPRLRAAIAAGEAQ